MSFQEEIQKLDYKNVLKYFVEISNVPRGSGFNHKISDYLVEFAKEHNLEYVQDEALNVIIYKKATVGYEAHTPVILQGHMDMVCLQEEGCQHNFETQGLDLHIDGDWLKADRTTLGGDDGIAVAFSMAILADDTLQHPAIEVVITTDEETGMDGAKALDCSKLKGRYMINIDSEDEGTVLVSCAGGMRFFASIPLTPMEAEGTTVTLTTRGLQGGHSGAEIHKQRTNANVLLARALLALKEDFSYLMITMKGGDKDNAIPSYSQAELLLKPEDVKAFEEKVNELNQVYQKELASSEPNVSLNLTIGENGQVTAIHPTSATKVLFALIEAPNGVQSMSCDMEGLVESSLNLGILDATGDVAEFHYSLRSSVSSYKYYMRDKLALLFEFLGAEYEGANEYPAWEYKKESKLREVFAKVYKEQYGTDPKMTAIHAGLECGLISEKIPDIDIVSIGPDMCDIHTPKERLSISSSIRVYKFLEKLLESCK